MVRYLVVDVASSYGGLASRLESMTPPGLARAQLVDASGLLIRNGRSWVTQFWLGCLMKLRRLQVRLEVDGSGVGTTNAADGSAVR